MHCEILSWKCSECPNLQRALLILGPHASEYVDVREIDSLFAYTMKYNITVPCALVPLVGTKELMARCVGNIVSHCGEKRQSVQRPSLILWCCFDGNAVGFDRSERGAINAPPVVAFAGKLDSGKYVALLVNNQNTSSTLTFSVKDLFAAEHDPVAGKHQCNTWAR